MPRPLFMEGVPRDMYAWDTGNGRTIVCSRCVTDGTALARLGSCIGGKPLPVLTPKPCALHEGDA